MIKKTLNLRSIVFITMLLIPFKLLSQNLYIDKAIDLELYNKHYWLKLLHYENNKSLINTKSFFLSKNGRTNPKEELIQTLKYFSTSKNICKYPLRYKWLNKKLNFDKKKPFCKKLIKYLSPEYSKVSIVFTSERYNSPSTLFGHTFLKVDSNTYPFAINFAAEVPDDIGSFSYAINGLFGKFTSKYKLLAYDTKDYEYRDTEFRDLLLYELNFDRNSIENIMFHLYEIIDTTKEYYFTTNNCSSELLRLLDLAKENIALSKELDFINSPIDIITILEKKSVIKNILKSTSKMKVFYKLYNQLSKTLKKDFFEVINYKKGTSYILEKNIKNEDKRVLVLSIMAYMEMKSSKGKFDTKDTYILLNLLKYINDKKLNYLNDEDIFLDKNPISTKFNKLNLGLKKDEKKLYQTIAYRYLYKNRFDLMDLGKKQGSIDLLDFSFENRAGNLRLDYLKLLYVEAKPIADEFSLESSAVIEAGLKKIFEEKRYIYFDYAKGHMFSYENIFDYGYLVEGSIYYRDKDIASSIAFDLYLELFREEKSLSQIEYEVKYFDNKYIHKSLSSNNSFKLTKDKTIDLNYEYDLEKKDSLIKINYNFFF